MPAIAGAKSESHLPDFLLALQMDAQGITLELRKDTRFIERAYKEMMDMWCVIANRKEYSSIEHRDEVTQPQSEDLERALRLHDSLSHELMTQGTFFFEYCIYVMSH